MDTTRSIQLFQVLRFGAQFFVGIALAKTSLSTADIGSFDTFLFLSTSLSFFWVGGYINALLPAYASAAEQDKPTVLFNAFIAIVGINILVCALLIATPITSYLQHNGQFQYSFLLVGFMLLNNPAFLVEYILLLRQRPIQLLAYGFVVFALQLTCTLVPVLLGYGLYGALLGMAVFAGVKFLVVVYLLAKESRPILDAVFMKRYARLAWPLGLSILMSGAGDLVDGFLVGKYYNRSTFAIFRYGARELPLALLLANSFSSSAIPLVATNLAEALAFIKSRSRQMMHWLFPITIILLLTSKYFYPLVFRAEFIESASVFNIFMLLLITRLLFPQTILNGLQQTRPILISVVIELALNIVCSLLLMQWYGLSGIAFGTVIAYAADKLFLMAYNYYHNSIHPNSYIDVRTWAIYAGLLIGAYVLGLYL